MDVLAVLFCIMHQIQNKQNEKIDNGARKLMHTCCLYDLSLGKFYLTFPMSLGKVKADELGISVPMHFQMSVRGKLLVHKNSVEKKEKVEGKTGLWLSSIIKTFFFSFSLFHSTFWGFHHGHGVSERLKKMLR